MSSNVGLSTPRGSGTSGYVQRNLSALRPRPHHIAGQPYPSRDGQSRDLHQPRQPDQKILAHERAREIESKVFELRDCLEDEGVEEEEIEERTEALRKELTEEGEKDGAGKVRDKAKLKRHQVHELAEEKAKEQERLRRALGIGKDYVEGSHWDRRREEKERAEGTREEKGMERVEER